MLVITRQLHKETILTVPPSTEWRTIVVTVTRVGQGQAQLGFTADDDVKVLRKELVEDTAKKPV